MNRILIPLVLLVSSSILYSQTQPRESLRDLNGVFLYVHPVGKEVEAGGLTTTQIRKVVEAQLHEANILIYNEPQPENGSANLVIIVDTVKHPQGAYLYDVEVSLLQEVHLARRQDPEPFPAQTWSAKALGLTTPNRMDLILAPLKEKVADFVTDYLTVNPKAHS